MLVLPPTVVATTRIERVDKQRRRAPHTAAPRRHRAPTTTQHPRPILLRCPHNRVCARGTDRYCRPSFAYVAHPHRFRYCVHKGPYDRCRGRGQPAAHRGGLWRGGVARTPGGLSRATIRDLPRGGRIDAGRMCGVSAGNTARAGFGGGGEFDYRPKPYGGHRLSIGWTGLCFVLRVRVLGGGIALSERTVDLPVDYSLITALHNHNYCIACRCFTYGSGRKCVCKLSSSSNLLFLAFPATKATAVVISHMVRGRELKSMVSPLTYQCKYMLQLQCYCYEYVQILLSRKKTKGGSYGAEVVYGYVYATMGRRVV